MDDIVELKLIADSLDSLKKKNIIRSNNLVGDLGEFYCKTLFNINLCSNTVQEGYDGTDKYGKKVQIKTRRLPANSAVVNFKNTKFDYCLFVELDNYFKPIGVYKITRESILLNIDKKRERLKISQLRDNNISEKLPL